MELNFTRPDLVRLWHQNPLAEAQLRAIVLERLYHEQERLIERLNRQVVESATNYTETQTQEATGVSHSNGAAKSKAK